MPPSKDLLILHNCHNILSHCITVEASNDTCIIHAPCYPPWRGGVDIFKHTQVTMLQSLKVVKALPVRPKNFDDIQDAADHAAISTEWDALQTVHLHNYCCQSQPHCNFNRMGYTANFSSPYLLLPVNYTTMFHHLLRLIFLNE